MTGKHVARDRSNDSGQSQSEEDQDERMVAVERSEWCGHGVLSGHDVVVREEPLEIRVGGIPVAVVMRTPGHDEALTWGFLVTERVIDSASEVRSIRHCTTVDRPEAEDNVVQVTLDPAIEVDFAHLRRNLFASSSCGICGKATIEQIVSTGTVQSNMNVSIDVMYRLPDQLRSTQTVFEQTGGLHGVALFDVHGELLIVHEDVGRHNAVDKVVGWAAEHRRLPLQNAILMVSGRVSYEIVQKAVAAGIPIVAAVSAPSSLAIELADRAGVTLVGFLRGERACVYTHAQRVR